MKKLTITIILAVLLLAVPVFAAPGIPGMVAGTVTTASHDNPAILAFDGYPGSYAIISDTDSHATMFLYDYQANGQVRYLGEFKGQISLQVRTSSTFMVIAVPRWDGDDVVIMVMR
jgi:hypothetical protein